MANINVKIVKCCDWQVLYINNEKKYENHRIDVDEDLFDKINQVILENGTIGKIEFESVEVDDEYMACIGCPQNYSDIPKDVILESEI